jgi:hypothetical protein
MVKEMHVPLQGDPVYVVNSQNLVTTANVPEHLRREGDVPE